VKLLDKKPWRTNSEFLKNALTLTLGTSIAQFFPLLFYPILGRVYTPKEFGLFATLTSITSILTVVASGKYESSILIARTKKDAANIVAIVFLISVPFLTLTFTAFLIFSQQISEILKEPELKKWLFISPLSAFLIIIYNSYNEWCVRNKYFVNLSWNKITNAASTALSKVFLGFVKLSSNGLILGDLIGRTISAGACILHAYKKDKTDFASISTNRIKELAKRYIEFPKFAMPDQLFNKIGSTLPILFIGAYYNSVVLGYYAMTMTVLSVPMSVIGAALRDVFRQRANEEYIIKGNCSNIYNRLLKILAVIGILGSLFIVYFLPSLFEFVLGKQWTTAGRYSQILLPMFTLNFISMSLSGVLVITEKIKISMYWQVYFVLITAASLFIGFYIFNKIEVVLLCLAIGRSTAYILYIILSYHFSK